MSGQCELPEFYATSEPVARRTYRCIECSAMIEKGERHLVCRGKWDGRVEVHRQHMVCAEACELIRDKFGGDCVPFGSLKEEFIEMRWQCCDKREAEWKRLRGLMAKIFWRERKVR